MFKTSVPAPTTTNVYHSFSSNLPHLQSWIDELILLTEQSLPKFNPPTTDVLVNSFQRYDVVFKELLRQCRIFSTPIAQMLSKLWGGILVLLKYMIKSYHRYVKHTSHLQEQAQNLLNERQRDQAANKIAKEEFELTVTALRARIRNLESEQESLFISRKVLEHENNKLRSIIDVYIRSSELNDPAWDIMSIEDISKLDGKDRKKNLNESLLSENEICSRRKSVIDEGRLQLKNLNRLDIELNEILTNTLKEENRQRLLLKDLMRLLVKNREILFPGGEDTVEGKLARVASVIKVPDSVHRVNPSKSSFTMNWSFLGSINTADTGAHDRIDVGIQIDDKDELGLILSTEETSKVDVLSLGVAPLAPSNVQFPGLDFPIMIRKKMSSFPSVLRVPTVAWACQSILAIYLDKLESDKERLAKGLSKLSLPHHIYEFFKKSLGVASAADVQVALLLKACEAHIRRQSRISLFASQIGLMNKEEAPKMDVRDTDFILQILDSLVRQGEVTADVPKTAKKRGPLQLGSYTRPDISRNVAVNVVYDVFRTWLPDGGEDYAVKVKSMQQSDFGPRFVDLDQFIELLIEPWHLVRSTWEDHARFLFKEHCGTYRVLQEATFANDDGVRASDTIVVEVKKSSANESGRRPLRIFQRADTIEDKDSSISSLSGSTKEAVCELIGRKAFVDCVQSIHPNLAVREIEAIFEEALELSHESVLRSLELMWVRYIDHASNYNVAGINRQSCTDQIMTALDNSEEYADLIVRPKSNHRVVGTNREFWVNSKTSISQWTRPFFPKTFRSQEVEVDIFVQVLINRDVFSKSPLVEFLNLPPKDLWPASSTLYKQILERTNKLKL